MKSHNSVSIKVRADNQNLRKQTEETWAAIRRVNEPPRLFAVANVIKLLNPETSTLSSVDIHELRWWLTQHIDFVAERDGYNVPKKPPQHLLQNLLAAPDKPLPQVSAVVRTPVFDQNAQLVSRIGYTPASQILYFPPPGFVLPALPSKIAENHLRRARDLISAELLGDFPFVGDGCKAHMIAALLLPFVRLLVQGPTPLHLISKPKAGTGATLLAELVGLVHAVKPYLLSWPDNEGERRRVLVGALLTGPRLVVLDNISRLEGAALSSCLTQTAIRDRLVGSSKIAEADNSCVWVATGNNPSLTDEVARRTVLIRIDAKSEYPDQRTRFRHPDLRGYIAEHLGDLVLNLLIPIRAWIDAGMPKWTERRLGGFESWSSTLGAILDVWGIPGFLQQVEAFRDGIDSDREAFGMFVASWWTTFASEEVTVSTLLDVPSTLDLGERTEHSAGVRLGKLLAKHEDQVIHGFRINRRRKVTGNQRWNLSRP